MVLERERKRKRKRKLKRKRKRKRKGKWWAVALMAQSPRPPLGICRLINGLGAGAEAEAGLEVLR